MADRTNTPTSRFLEDVSEQISYKPLRPSIARELEDHIRDRADQYRSQGLSQEEAEKKAVAAMGNPVSIGTELNAIHHTRVCVPLIALTAVLLLSGFFAASYMQWSPEQNANGFLYYLPGIALLIFITLKGYPWLIRYQNLLFWLAVILYGIQFLWELLLLWKPELTSMLFLGRHFFPYHMMRYYATLLFAPVLAIAAYRARRKPVAAICILLLSAGLLIWFGNITRQSFTYSVTLIFLTAVTATAGYMILQGVFQAPKGKLLLIAGAGCLLSFGLFAARPSQNYFFQAFANPEAVTNDTWDDSYNSLLIKELLSRTPATEGISLTPAEMMDYSTGRWYFESRDETKIRWVYEANDDILEEGRDPEHPNYRNTAPVYHKEANVTLWDILPQHYHNNYLVTVAILLYGWLPALCLFSLPVLFFLVLFACIRGIRGKLAGSVAFCCVVILLMQGVLYLLGNLGFQYETFTNLPLVSEGKVSILANMLLLGFIFSAYRYDRVTDEAAVVSLQQKSS